MRKIIQIVETPDSESYQGYLTALCNDGSIWYLQNNNWAQLLPVIPQDQLNEHREPEVKLNERFYPVAEITSTHTGNSDGQFFNVNWLTTDFNVGDKLYLHPQATPNKAEVPESKNIIDIKRTGDQSVSLTFASCRSCSAFINSLPPLKGDEK